MRPHGATTQKTDIGNSVDDYSVVDILVNGDDNGELVNDVSDRFQMGRYVKLHGPLVSFGCRVQHRT
jgi:hypothetical protein